jgi:predicted nucleic acid-binding protein
MTEILAKPYRTLTEKEVRQMYNLLLVYPNLEWIAPDLEIAETAAQLRAVYKLETPDALQAATAVRSGATGLVTNGELSTNPGLRDAAARSSTLRWDTQFRRNFLAV